MLVSSQLGFSLNPIKAVKKGVHAVAHPLSTVKSGARAVVHPIRTTKAVVRDTAHTAASTAKTVGHVVKVGLIKPAEWLAHAAMTPVRNRVHKLRSRRAVKLAWDRRKSKTPTPAEQSEASAWTKDHLKHEGPHGRVLALFAGAAPANFGASYSGLGDPATASVVAASVPVLVALIDAVLRKSNNPNEAPADPAADAQAAADTSPADAGTADLAPAQDAATDAAAAADAESGGGGGLRSLTRGGKILGIDRKYVFIGGAVLGAVLLIGLLKPKS